MDSISSRNLSLKKSTRIRMMRKKIKKIMNLIFSMNLYQKNNEYYKNSLAQKHEVKYRKNTK